MRKFLYEMMFLNDKSTDDYVDVAVDNFSA